MDYKVAGFMLLLGGFIICDLDLLQNLQDLFESGTVIASEVTAKNFTIDAAESSIKKNATVHESEVKAEALSAELEAGKEIAAVVSQASAALGRVDMRKNQCNIFSGKWVFDPDYPLYQSSGCPFIESRFRCLENGRTDSNYTKFRWQPHDCNIPRFDPISMLQLLKNKRVVFSGDSIGRNQWQSFVCMLYQGAPDKSKVYEVRGQRISRRHGEFSVRFADYNATIEFYGSHFLVMEVEGPPTQLTLDKMSRMSKKWLGADVLVFNTVHWWNKVNLIQSYQEHGKVNLTMDPITAYSKGMSYWAKWVDSHFDISKVRVFFRAIAPSHFKNGKWNTGGVCHLETQPIFEESSLSQYQTKRTSIVEHQKMSIVEHLISNMKMPVTFLNTTILTQYRKDGHISIWHPEQRGSPVEARITHQDCSHWCLPGVPDTWNELLSYALLYNWGQP